MTDFGKRVGDMSKSTYDTNKDDVVDDSEKLDGKSKAEIQDHAPKSHVHAQSDVTNLATSLAGKAATTHEHVEANITDLDHDAVKIAGVIINDAAIADQKVLAYDSGTERIVYITPAPAGGLLKTGQTTSYETGDDGDLELGIVHDYTVLDTGQYAESTDIEINSKTHALSNNCVQDNVTGLMWSRYVPLASIGPYNNGTLFWTDPTNGEDIWAFLQQANANSLGGHNDWRIPNFHELPSIVNIGNCNPAIDTTAFPLTPSTYHWTASTHPCESTYAFNIYFYNGHVSLNPKETNGYYVRLVRG